MEELCLLLTSTLKTATTTADVQQYIQKIAGGASPHRYDALRLAFGSAVNAIKEAEFMLRPRLRCTVECVDEEFSIDSAKVTKGMCNNCRGPLSCSVCWELWRGDDACRECGESFR